MIPIMHKTLVFSLDQARKYDAKNGKGAFIAAFNEAYPRELLQNYEARASFLEDKHAVDFLCEQCKDTQHIGFVIACFTDKENNYVTLKSNAHEFERLLYDTSI